MPLSFPSSHVEAKTMGERSSQGHGPPSGLADGVPVSRVHPISQARAGSKLPGQLLPRHILRETRNVFLSLDGMVAQGS